MAAKKIEIIYDINGKAIDVAVEKTLNLQQAAKALTAELRRTKEGSDEFQVLSKRLGDTQDGLKAVNAKSQDLFGSLSLLPGPIGLIGGSLSNAVNQLKLFTSFNAKDLSFQLKEVGDDVLQIGKNLLKLTGITKIYDATSKLLFGTMRGLGVSLRTAAVAARALSVALASTGILLLVAAVGELIQAYDKWSKSAEDARVKQEELNAEVAKGVQAGTDAAIKFLKVTNDIDVARAEKANKTEKEIQVIRQRGFDEQIVQLKDNLKKLQAVQGTDTTAAADAISDAQDAKTLQQLQFDKKQQDNQKSANTTAADIEKDYQKRLRALKNENALLQISDEFERSKVELRQQYDNQVEEINQLKITTDKKTNLKLEAEKNYQLKLKALTKKNEEEVLKGLMEFEFKRQEILANAIEDEYDRQVELRKIQLDQAIYEIDQLKISETRKQKLREALEKTAARDIAKINEERLLTTIDLYKKQEVIEGQFETQKLEGYIAHEQSLLASSREFRKYYVEEYKKNNLNDRQTLEQRYQEEYTLIQGQLDNQLAQVKQAYDLQRITKDEYVTKSNELNQKKYDNDKLFSDRSIQLQLIQLEAERNIQDAKVSIYQNASNLLSALAGKNFELQKAAAIAEAGVAIARIVIDTQRANVAFAASVAPLGPAGVAMAASYSIKSTIAAGFAIATIVAQGIQKLESISWAQVEAGKASSGSSGGGAQGNGMGRGYADGGLIGGRRHAQGGTMIEAERGEAIMTRGAVTMFAPLLSTLNQMGGGTSFNLGTQSTTYDKPVDANNNSEQTIIKTYVVESDLTSAQHRQARLKDLSTL